MSTIKIRVIVGSTGRFFELDVNPDLPLEIFFSLCAEETGVPVNKVYLSHNGRQLLGTFIPISRYGIRDGDVVVMQQLVQAQQDVPNLNHMFNSMNIPPGQLGNPQPGNPPSGPVMQPSPALPAPRPPQGNNPNPPQGNNPNPPQGNNPNPPQGNNPNHPQNRPQLRNLGDVRQMMMMIQQLPGAVRAARPVLRVVRARAVPRAQGAPPAPRPPLGNNPNAPEGNNPNPLQGNNPNAPQGNNPNPPQGNNPNAPQGNNPNAPQGNNPNAPQGNNPNPPQNRRQQRAPELLRQMLLAQPEAMDRLRIDEPELAYALESGDIKMFAEELAKQQKIKQEEAMKMNSTPGEIYSRKVKIEKQIMQSVQDSKEAFSVHSPEAYESMVLLHIDCLLNNTPVRALVDPGARMTSITARCAARCNLTGLVDTNWRGFPNGGGASQQQIVGRIHMVPIQIVNDHLATAFNVIEPDQPIEMTIGLDWLKSYQCNIDLKMNALIIGTLGRGVKFVSDMEIRRMQGMLKQLPVTIDDGAKKEKKEEKKTKKDRQVGSTSSSSSSCSTDSCSSADIDTLRIRPDDPFAEAAVMEIMALGFPRSQVMLALRAFAGNVDQAKSMLLARR